MINLWLNTLKSLKTHVGSALRRRVLCFYLEAVVAVAIGVGLVGAPSGQAAGQVVEGHNGDGK